MSDADIRRLRRRQGLVWLATLAGLALLLSRYSAGFFLYAAVVTGAVLALAAVFPAASLAGLEVRRSLGASEIELGETTEARLVLHNRKVLPALWIVWRDEVDPGLEIQGTACGFKTLDSEETSRTAYRLRGTRRGLFRVGPAVVEASDPFGLVRRFRLEPQVGFVTVFPRAVPLGPGWPLGHRPIHEVPRRRSFVEDPSRFLGLRDYRPGDSLRRIHWRATARSGRLQVKLFEPAVLEGVLLAVEMGQGPNNSGETGTDPVVELTVTAAASLAEFVLGHGQSVGLLSNGGDAADRYPADWTGGSFRRLEDALAEAGARRRISAHRPVEVEPGRDDWQRDRLRAALARLTPAPGLSLPELLTAEAPRLPRSHVVLVVTPDLDEPLAAALGVLRRSGFEVGVVWIQRPGADPATAARLQNVPVHVVAEEADLAVLGSRPL